MTSALKQKFLEDLKALATIVAGQVQRTKGFRAATNSKASFVYGTQAYQYDKIGAFTYGLDKDHLHIIYSDDFLIREYAIWQKLSKSFPTWKRFIGKGFTASITLPVTEEQVDDANLHLAKYRIGLDYIKRYARISVTITATGLAWIGAESPEMLRQEVLAKQNDWDFDLYGVFDGHNDTASRKLEKIEIVPLNEEESKKLISSRVSVVLSD